MSERPYTPCLQIVGGLQTADEGFDEGWLGEIFTRVTNEVRHTGAVSRVLGFEITRHERPCARFFGIEVERIAEIPQGMLAWTLDGNSWVVRQQVGERDVIIRQTVVDWLWSAPACSGNGRWCGEYTAPCPVEWGGNAEVADFRITTNAYLRPRDLHYDDAIELVAYDPDWPRQYAECATRLREVLGPEVALRIEHYGSTAIPGIPAKPIIDILIEVPSFALARQRTLSCLNDERWEYWWYRDHMTFIKRQELMGKRTHHLHLAPAGHQLWEGIAFRDYLRTHPKVAARYAALKEQLAAQHGEDREKYTEAKTAFVQEINTTALAER